MHVKRSVADNSIFCAQSGPLQCIYQKNDDISIANLDWRLTNLTNEKLKLTVRRGAVKDAVVKALDYCSVFSPSAETVWECDAKEISDESSMGSVGYGGAAPRAMMMRSSGPGGGEKSLNFEPEDVSITARVHCKFECHEEGR